MAYKKYLELLKKSTTYQVYFGTDDYDDDECDEYEIIRIEDNGKVTWKIESIITGDSITKSSNVGKKLIKYCIENG
jgi:geranylgeranyl pyrophosphate synthase